jgi:hypothetical protein
MGYIHLINTVRIWERRLEIEREKQKNAQKSSYSSSLAELERLRKVRKPVFARFTKPKRGLQPVCCAYTRGSCLENQG